MDSRVGQLPASSRMTRWPAIFRWINWYNATRLQSTPNYTPPAEWEQ